jgi:hypothetical protein
MFALVFRLGHIGYTILFIILVHQATIVSNAIVIHICFVSQKIEVRGKLVQGFGATTGVSTGAKHVYFTVDVMGYLF